MRSREARCSWKSRSRPCASRPFIASPCHANDRDALLELAALYEKNHQNAEAIAIYQQFPENAAAQAHVGQLLLESRHSADAIAPLEAAMQKNPTPANRLALATAYLFEKQFAKALPLLDQSVAAEPGNYALHID